MKKKTQDQEKQIKATKEKNVDKDPFETSEDDSVEELPKPSGKRVRFKNKTKTAKKPRSELAQKMLSGSESEYSQSGMESSDEEAENYKKSTIVQTNYQGYLNDKAFLTALGRGPRSSIGSLNSFVEVLEDLPENLQLEGGSAFKKWSRDLNEQCRNLEEMVTYSAKKGCVKKLQKISDSFEDLKKKTLPSKRKCALKRVLGWLKKASTQKIISSERATDIKEALESEREDNRAMFKMSSIMLENWNSKRDRRNQGGYGGNQNGFNGNRGGGYRGGRGNGRGRGRGNRGRYQGQFGGQYSGQQNQSGNQGGNQNGNKNLYGQTQNTI